MTRPYSIFYACKHKKGTISSPFQLIFQSKNHSLIANWNVLFRRITLQILDFDITFTLNSSGK